MKIATIIKATTASVIVLGTGYLAITSNKQLETIEAKPLDAVKAEVPAEDKKIVEPAPVSEPIAETTTPQVAEQAVEAPAAVAPVEPAQTYYVGCDAVRSLSLTNGVPLQDVIYAQLIADKESSCGANIVNPSSGACGYFQELPCGKWGGTTDVAAHIQGANRYAWERYGGWANAWKFWNCVGQCTDNYGTHTKTTTWW